MLATASVHELLENTKTNEILCGRLLPTNNNIAFVDNDSIFTVTVIDESQKSKPIAFGAFQICSKNQAYFILNECDPLYVNKHVAVERVNSSENDEDVKKSHCCLKIVKRDEEEVDFSVLPQYFGAFGKRTFQPVLVHIYDELVEMTLKTYNMDVSKNITIDLYEPDDLTASRRKELRDCTGLLVSNDCINYEITIQKRVLQSLLSGSAEQNQRIKYEEITEKNECYVQDYDATTSLYNRQNYIEFLLKIKEIKGVIAFEGSEAVGYAFALNNRIMQCYAESDHIARGLVKELVCKMNAPTVSMFIREGGDWIATALHWKASQVKKIQRFHSRVVPSQIKWPNIYVMNIGLYLY